MKKAAIVGMVVLALLPLLSVRSHGQSRIKGEIQGTVLDDKGEALPGVTVALTGEPLFQKSLAAVTNTRGVFRFVGLNPGLYEIACELQGFNAVKMTAIEVLAGKSSPVVVRLAAASIRTEVTVIAKPPLIETKTPQQTTTLDNSLVANLPVARNASSFVSLMNSAPGFFNNTGYGAAGGSEATDIAYGSYTTNFQLNGLSVDNVKFGYTTVNPIYETIEEVQIVGVGASAEYGNYIGASVNVVTKSGTNKLHGSLTGLFTDHSFYGNNSPGSISQLEPQNVKYDAETTGTLSGPIVPEKLFFFVGGGFYGTKKKYSYFTDFQSIQRPRVYAKLDWAANNRNTVSVLWNSNPIRIDPQSMQPGNAETTWVEQTVAMNAVIATWQSILSERSYFNLKFAGYGDKNVQTPLTPGIPFYRDNATGLGYGSSMQGYDSRTSRIELSPSFTHYLDDFLGTSHELKIGLEYDRAQEHSDNVYSGGGYLVSQPSGDQTMWRAFTGGNTHTKGIVTRLGGYFQDNFKLGKRLNLNIGLRYEQPTITAKDYPDQLARFHLFSPRFGFSYDILGDAKYVFHASYGVYYNKILTWTFRQCLPGNEDQNIYTLTLPTAPFDATAENLQQQLALVAQPTNLASTVFQKVPFPVDADLRVPRSDYYSLGFSNMLGEDFVLSIDYIYKQDRNRMTFVSDAVHTYAEREWTDSYIGRTITVWDQVDRNPDTGVHLTNSSFAKKRHHFVMVELRKRPSQRWSMLFSYVYQNSKSNFPLEGDIGGSAPYNIDTDPEFFQNPYLWGREWDRQHQFKLMGTYLGPWGISLSGNMRVVSGLPWTPQISSSYTGIFRSTGSFNILLEPKGSRRAPFQSNFDVRLAKLFKLAGTQFEVFADVFNLFNSASYEGLTEKVTSKYPEGISAFGQPWTLENPRYMRLGFNWRF